MRTETKRLVINLLKEYPQMDEKIAKRENELMHPIKEADDNIGGGRAQNHPWTYHDNLVITIDEDREINTWKRERQVIGDCLDNAGEETVKIITNIYMKKYPVTIKELVATGKIWCSQTKAYKLRDQFITEVAKQLGIVFY